MKKSTMIFYGLLISAVLILPNISPVFAQTPMIAFLSDRSGDSEIYLLFDNGVVERLTKNKSRTIDPDWSPDGKTIIFSSNKLGGEAYDIFLIDVETKKQTNLTEGQFGGNKQKPRWAPAGEPRATFEGPGLPNADNWDVGLMDLTTQQKLDIRDVVNITNIGGEGKGQDIEAAWSPDGTMIAFQGQRDGKFNIFIADMDLKKPGANQRNITKALETAQRPRWSPDGSTILFESKKDGDWEIFSIGIDGNDLQQLTNNEDTDRNAEWSTGGIVFESKRDGNFEIYRMDDDGSHPVNLTNNDGLDSKPIWSPNGAKILFESRRDGDREIYVVDADGSNLQKLTNNPAKDTFARWNPQFFFLAVEPQEKKLVTLGEVKNTMLLQNYPNPFNPETWFPYYLSKDASITMRIYNMSGELVRLLAIGEQPAGAYVNRDRAVHWDGRDRLGQRVASGVYFYELQANEFSQTHRMVLMK